jgi:hypothetical protein
MTRPEAFLEMAHWLERKAKGRGLVVNSFKIEVDGMRYQGAWLVQGDVLEVRSDYGATTVPLGDRDAAATARELLRQLARVPDDARQTRP